jgi:hypothetical protein
LSKGTGPLNVLFNQSALPTGGLPGDVTLLTDLEAGTNTLSAQGAPPALIPGRRYFLGVQNTGPTPETFHLEVRFDVGANSNILVLTNQVAVATNISTHGPEFYSFTVPTNATMVTFQVLNPANAELDLYARAGLPVPGPLSFDYESRNSGTNDQFIVVTTNSLPVPLPTATTNTAQPLSPTTWYLAVYNFSGATNAGYTILATFMTDGANGARGAMDVIPLANGVPKPGTAPPGYPTNLLYSFTVANNPPGVQFVVSNLSGLGNLELLVGDGIFPTPEQSYSGSFNGTAVQTVEFGTSAALPSLANTIWYLAVPNTSTSTNSVNYTITATTITNGVVTTEPLFISASISSPTSGFSLYWNAAAGQTYTIEVSTNLTSWAVVTNIVAQSNTATYTDSVPANTQQSRFFRLTTP